MTTYIAFLPTANANPPFQTTITLDGNSYSLTAFWNAYRVDWYMALTDLAGNVIVTQPLIASPNGADINLVYGLFTTSTLVFRDQTQNFEVTP